MNKKEHSIDDFTIGEMVLDTYNEFNKKDFEFIEDQAYDISLAMCEIINKTKHSICIRVKKWPLRILWKDGGGVSNPIEHDQWFKFKREHEYEIGFNFRFKKA